MVRSSTRPLPGPFIPPSGLAVFLNLFGASPKTFMKANERSITPHLSIIRSRIMNLNNSRHTNSEQPSSYPLGSWSRSSQRMPYPSSNESYYPPAQGSPPLSPTMTASPYSSNYSSYSATSPPPSGMSHQQNYHSAARHSPYQSPVTSSQHNSPSLPYPPQNNITSSDPRSAYSHNRSMSLPQQSYPSSSMSNHSYSPHGSQHGGQLMVQSVDQTQYPASPQRPFACDMCALSFNRQHDLKRHRETHSGEKPFLCNGGCGKTFTRKDALKRHQVRPSSYRSFIASLPSFSTACEKVWF